MSKVRADMLPRVDKWIRHYILVRNEIAEIKQRHKQELERLEDVLKKLGGTLLEFLDKTGQESARTDAGTVYASVKDAVSVSDPDAFMECVKEYEAFYLLDRRANAKACREWADTYGKLPPGVTLSTLRTVGVRTS